MGPRCRLVVTLEATGGQQSGVAVPSTTVSLFTVDGGNDAQPTIAAANYGAPTELGSADVHTAAFLFASTAGDSKNKSRRATWGRSRAPRAAS